MDKKTLLDIFVSQKGELTAQEAIQLGMDWGFTVDYFLKSVGLNARLRYFAKTLIYSKKKPLKINDSEFAEILDCSRETVSRIRKRFLNWQKSSFIKLLEINEGQYLRDKNGRFYYSPSEYEVICEKIINESIIEARKNPKYRKNSNLALKEVIDRKLQNLRSN